MPERPDDAPIREGLGTRLAEWTIAAIDGSPVSATSMSPADARSLRRVNDTVAALREAHDERVSGRPA